MPYHSYKEYPLQVNNRESSKLKPQEENDMHRQQLLNLLSEYNDQSHLKQRFIDFIEKYEDCFSRENTYGHITGSCWLLDRTGEKTLLTHHRKLNMWLQPGGHCDGDSDVTAVSLKEAIEETGIERWDFVDGKIFDIDCHEIPARKDEPGHFHFDIRFAMICGESEKYTVSEESHDLAWVPLQDLQSYTKEESILRMARKWEVTQPVN